MNSDLEAIIAADEEARARVEAARAAFQGQVQAAVNERERRRQERYAALLTTAQDEELCIREAADRAVADRKSSRARYLEARRQATESTLARAAHAYVRIIRDGPTPGTRR
jgi:hypothetical protein